ncbi:hypothetical protein E2C01_068699 [Portunus trituberculatus]|uniref:Uncharacterized protein n=1 Tax=Portunus trituberculatus TaxID=210409 RepID=A0A5B7HN21_PORTR|nr:hypothetical protein [Portunus trituberculatus]
MAFPAFPTVLAGCVSSPILEAFITKVSEVEAESEFHRRISEVREEFRGRNSDLNETHGQEEWQVASRQVETANSFAVLEGVEEKREKAGGNEVRMADDSCPQVRFWQLVTTR